MHVLFLEIDTQRDWSVASIGPAYLGASIRKVGHEASLLRINEEEPVKTLIEAIHDRKPDLIGVSLTSRQWLGAKRLLNGLREHVDIPVITGGLHPTFSPDATIAEPGIDYVCLGEGERAFMYFVEAMEAGLPITDGSIDNIQTSVGNRPVLGKPFEPIDDLPFMARDLLDEQHGVVHICTQRGCPFPCTYCAARMYDELYAEQGGAAYGRRRSHENVLEELFEIRDQGSLNYVIFLDDTFTIHHP
ncbi:MAG: cobalamin-dependent protein, partial [Planctomycetota bacterium]|nr:cobalamin-dependent protein [Planctomycetota bacterium]